MYLGESSLFFFSVAALQALLQPVDRFLNVWFLFMLFKLWHLESFLKGRSQQFSGGLSSARARQGEATLSPAGVRSLPPSRTQSKALWWAVKDISLNSFQFCVRFAYKIQHNLQKKKNIGKFCGADVVGTDRNNSEMLHGQKYYLLKTKAESKSIHLNVYTFLKKKKTPKNTHTPQLSHMHLGNFGLT